ncbi:zinc ABC transporter substrate-binding protein [Dactylosporangium aurantiacum]|uniref:Zinc ABC transporter substrate-binding protein n=1 Tax=Dactylosporangium aurantiacum TaxID=35754 RepID=A0A9Q9MN63_9ACTN|nr:metal ABC transporter substrate-binding protein [Dactylosporangium aurantiacum]MDG6103856.1 metal ABC transporter substrate-binding protein [Dactylosporangium aurantiacum]UWZ58946.1 zinc ABC transporter substrate-binding protein [Dactylosporangium aurantiacum]
MQPRRRSLAVTTVLTALTAALAACGGGPATTAQPGSGAGSGAGARLAVVATTTQVADFARVIGGDRVAVTQIIQPNIDPHDYEPTPADLTAIRAAKVLVKNGVGLEGWLDATIASAGFRGTTVDASAGVRIRQGEGEEAEHGDPHIWHDPRNAKRMVQTIERAFAAAAPGDADTFARNLAGYGAQLDALDAGIAAKLGALPAADRKLVTNHDAFGYYIDRYQLQFVGSIIPSFDTSAELSAKDVDDIVARIRQTGAKAVFSESSLPPKTAEAIAKQAGVKVVAGEDALYGDSLGPEGSAGDTYLKMEQHNTDTIVRALGG